MWAFLGRRGLWSVGLYPTDCAMKEHGHRVPVVSARRQLIFSRLARLGRTTIYCNISLPLASLHSLPTSSTVYHSSSTPTGPHLQYSTGTSHHIGLVDTVRPHPTREDRTFLSFDEGLEPLLDFFSSSCSLIPLSSDNCPSCSGMYAARQEGCTIDGAIQSEMEEGHQPQTTCLTRPSLIVGVNNQGHDG